MAICLMGSPLHAQTAGAETARGGPAFDRGQAAWSRGDFDVAEGQLKSAIEQGGLPRKDLLRAYILLGSARAVLGQHTGALAAFRGAAELDPSFKVPAEAGKKVAHVADTAKKERTGALSIRADAPSSVEAGQAFGVDVSLSLPPRAPLSVTRVDLEVSEGLASTPTFKSDAPAAAKVHFDLPGKVATPGSNLFVRVSGVDAHGNELVTGDVQLRVQGSVQAPAPVTAPVAAQPTESPAAASPKTSPALATTTHDTGEHKSGGGFWSSPWPYLIGGALLAGAGVGGYFLLRPPDHVNVTQIQVQAIR